MHLPKLKIESDEDGTIYERGLVETHGAAAAIYDWDTEKRRYVQKDRLTEATITKRRGGWTLTGVSQGLIRTVGVPKDDARVKLILHAGKGKAIG
jgi:hypothetical protein